MRTAVAAAEQGRRIIIDDGNEREILGVAQAREEQSGGCSH